MAALNAYAPEMISLTSSDTDTSEAGSPQAAHTLKTPMFHLTNSSGHWICDSSSSTVLLNAM